MKIGIDIRTLMDKKYSGVSEFSYHLVKTLLALNAAKPEHEYILYYNSGRDIADRMSSLFSGQAKIIQTNYPNKIFNYLFQAGLRWPKIDQLLGLDHRSSGASLFFMPHINFISLSAQSKKIITVHDLSFMRYPEFYSRRKNIWHCLISVKKLLRHAVKIIAVSENTKRDLIELCQIPEEKITVIYPGISQEYVLINNPGLLAAVKTKYQLPNKYILYLGTIEPRKNINGLVAAFDLFMQDNRNADYVLVLAGARGWKCEAIDKAIKNSPNCNKIKSLGYVDWNDKVALYNLAKLFVYPSLYEGFGFPPLEAMACGTPVIVSNNSSLPEATGGGALSINPLDISELAVSMTEVITNQKLRDVLTGRALKIAAGYTWQKTARAYLGVFNSLK